MEVAMSADLKAKVLEGFRQKSKGDKKMFYIKDVVKWLPDEDRHAIQAAVKELLDEEAVRYWSSGSTTYLVLAECYPKDEGSCS
jgi:hypothetical protein